VCRTTNKLLGSSKNPDQTHTGARSSNGQGSPQSWYEEDSRVMVHWYSPFWGPGRGPGFKLNPVRGVVCPLDETPTDPSANDDLDLGVPTACQIGSTVVLPKNPKKETKPKKQTLEKLITIKESMKLATTL